MANSFELQYTETTSVNWDSIAEQFNGVVVSYAFFNAPYIQIQKGILLLV
jgi:hypothetical protein